MNTKVKIGIIQMEIMSDIFDKETRKQNVDKAEELINQLCENDNLDMVVLPEEFYAGSGYGPISMPDNLDTVKKQVFDRLGEVAKKHNVYIAGALLAKNDQKGFKSNNMGFIIDRNGQVIGYQERFHLSPQEIDFTNAGTEYKLFELDFGKVALLLGSDLLFPEVARNFVLKGAEILISPILSHGEKRDDNEKAPYLNDLFSCCAVARAMENQAYIVMVNGVGDYVHIDKVIFGESLVAGPIGKISQLGQEQQTQVVELDLLDKVEACKHKQILEIRNKDICKVLD